jgi:hypothetical protein
MASSDERATLPPVPDALPWIDLSGFAGTAVEPLIHARKRFGLPALCGELRGMWAVDRYVVTCRACLEEIARRLAARAAK